MPVEVVDASAVAAILFDEPEGPRVVGRLGAAARLVAPALLDFELASVCLKKARLHPERRAELQRALALRSRMAIDILAVAHGEVVTLADSTGLSAYDASYLWLAQRLGAGLVTLDRRLAAAAAASASPLEESVARFPARNRRLASEIGMCRNTRTLFNFEPPATDAEVRAAALQFVRKISGFNKPSLANEPAFGRAVDEVAAAARTLMGSLITNAQARDRTVEAQKARQRGQARFASTG